MSDLRRFIIIFAIVDLIVVAGGAAAFYVWKHGLNLPETVQTPVFEPLTGAVADRIVLQTQEIATSDLSTTLPVSTSMAEIPFGHFAVPMAEDAGIDGVGGDADIPTVSQKAGKARLYKFENKDICFDGLCPIGLFPVREDGTVDMKNPIFVMAAVNIEVSSHMTEGNPDLVVDYGVRGGKQRMVWSSTDGMYEGVPDGEAP